MSYFCNKKTFFSESMMLYRDLLLIVVKWTVRVP